MCISITYPQVALDSRCLTGAIILTHGDGESEIEGMFVSEATCQFIVSDME